MCYASSGIVTASLCKLVKLATSAQMHGLSDQIIKRLLDGNTIEALLQEADLTLEQTINKCRAQEAVKRQHSNITDHGESVSTPQNT